MNDEEKPISSSGLDIRADAKIELPTVKSEKFKDGVARDPNPLRNGEDPQRNQSWTMSEIERNVASDILDPRQKKLAQYGLLLQRRNDFRLPDLTKRLTAQLKTDFNKEISTGPLTHRLRRFDLQSQTMRMISANAALGNYQFQKRQTLPFMRKSLALGYQKVELLKQVSGGISSLERMLSAKLDAIKLNTAAAVPEKKGFIKTIFDDIKEERMKRIKGNISNLVLARQDAMYKKHVAPIFSRIHAIMKNTTPKGGVNGVKDALTRSLNKIRHRTEAVAHSSSSGYLEKAAAGAATGALSGAISFGQSHRLGDGTNRFVSKHLASPAEFMDQLRPFAPLIRNPLNPTESGEFTPDQARSIERTTSGGSSMGKAVTLLTDWRKESSANQAKLLEHVAAIRQRIAPLKLATATTKTPRTQSLAPTNSHTAKIQSVAHKSHLSTLPTIRTAKDAAKPRVIRLTAAHPTVTISPPTQTPKISTNAVREKVASVVHRVRHNPFTHGDPHKVPDTHPKADAMKALMGSLGKRFSNLDLAISKESKARLIFEKAQEKTRVLAEKAKARLQTRKGSYEEIEAERKTKRGLFGRAAGAAGTAAVVTPNSPALNPTHAGAAGLLGTGMSSLTELAGVGIGAVGKTAGRFGWKATKFATRTGFRFAKKAIPFTAKTGFKALRGATKFGLREAKGAGRLGGKALISSAKLGARGLLAGAKLGGAGLLKVGTSGFGLGLAASVGNHFLQKSHASSGVKRAGGTALNMASYGLMGAEIGSIIPGVGTLIGAGVGAAIGAVVANSDYAGKAFHALGHRTALAADGLWTRLFGQKAIVNYDGSVRQQEKLSLFGEVKSLFFGKKARYSSSGELIAPEHMSIIGGVKYGFQKLFFGDKFSNGEYKQGTSLFAEMRDGITKSLKDFGDAIMNLPGQIKKGFNNVVDKAGKAVDWTKKKVGQGINAVETYASNKVADVKNAASAAGNKATSLYNNFSVKNIKAAGVSAIEGAGKAAYFMTPAGFAVGASSAVFGWTMDSGAVDNPATPYYALVGIMLDAYGVKNRAMYKFVHSLELSQERVNNREIKPFNDDDMAYMSGRFGFDVKNKDAVNYFKLWFKRRFMPAMAIIGKVLKSHKLTFASVMGANEKEITAVNADLKKELASTDLKSIGLEPTPQAFNRYAHIGAADPGGANGGGTGKIKPFDPRDPKSQMDALTQNMRNSHLNGGGAYDSPNNGGGYGSSNQKAERKSAKLVKGDVKQQPEFVAAYQKLPPNIRKMVDKSKALQFVLWSTSFQHGADNASKIFQKDYSDKLDEKSYIHSIYQDRSTRFSNLNSDDRVDAVRHMGEEERFADGIQDGSVRADMNTMGQQLSNVVDPSGNSNLGYDASSIKPQPVTGTDASRAKDAVNYLMTKRYTRTAAIGIVANLLRESRLNTAAIGDNGRAHGIAQWHPDRRAKIFKQFHKAVEAMNLHEQLDAIDWEIRSGNGITGGKDLAGSLNAATNVGQAVSQMVDRYERPADRQGEKLTRTKIAAGLMKAMGDNGGTGQPTGSATKGGGAATPAAKPAKTTASTTPSPQNGKAAPTTKPAAKPAPHPLAGAMDGHASVLKDNTAALNRHADALAKNSQTPSGNNTSIVTPIMKAANDAGGFIAMSMKKFATATGE